MKMELFWTRASQSTIFWLSRQSKGSMACILLNHLYLLSMKRGAGVAEQETLPSLPEVYPSVAVAVAAAHCHDYRPQRCYLQLPNLSNATLRKFPSSRHSFFLKREPQLFRYHMTTLTTTMRVKCTCKRKKSEVVSVFRNYEKKKGV